MKSAIALIKLTRPINLAIIAATLFAMRYWVVLPLIAPKGIALLSGIEMFSLLVLSVVFIAAAGNIINDYFDTKTDAINKPESMIVGVSINRRIALFWHGFLTFSGIAIAAFYGWKTGSLRFVLLHVFVAISLWFYSTYFKKETAIGNVVIALLTGLVPFTIAFFDVVPLINQIPEDLRQNLLDQGISISFFFKIIFCFLLGFSLFSFVGNLVRELYKDLSDIEGDRKTGRKTLPIIWGETACLWIIVGYILIWTASLLYVEFVWLKTTFSLVYISLGLILPMVLSVFLVFRSPNQKNYKKASTMVKVVLLLGLGFSYFLKDVIVG